MNFVILAALGICFGYAVLERGGVGWSEWSLTLLSIGVIGCLHFLWSLLRRIVVRKGEESLPPFDPIAGFSAAAFLLLVALQLVPLPASLVRHLSPQRVELQQAARPFANVSSSQVGTPQSSTALVTLSAVPNATGEYLLTTSSYVLVFLLIRDLSLRLAKFPWATSIPILVVVGLEAALGLLQVSGGGVSGFATGTYASRDHYAGLIEMALPFPVMFAVAALRRDPTRDSVIPALKASLLLGIAAIMLVAIVLSLSRMGFLAALASLLVAGVAAVSLGNGNYTRGRLRAWVPATAVAMVVLLGLLFLPTTPLLARFADMSHTSDISPDTRVQIWRDAEGLVKDYPLFGCGMGGFESCFLKYKTVAPMSTVDYAHNDYLQVLAELGVFGFAAGLLFVGRVFQRAVRAISHASSVDGRHLAVACVASMTAMLMHSFVDFNMYVPANGMLFAWVAGIAGVYTSRFSSQSELIA